MKIKLFLSPAKMMNTLSLIKNIKYTFSFIICLFISSNLVYAEVSVIDDIGQTIKLKTPAKNIISLSPGLTELVFASGGGDYLKGVVSYSDFPEAAKKLPQIGSYNAVDIEKIVALNPDLVVAWKSGNPPLQISKLKKLGLMVYTSETRNFDDIPSTLLRLGVLMNTTTIANQAATKFNNRLQTLKTRYPKTNDKKRVFIQIWNQPIMSINGKHLISKIVDQCNGMNIFHDTTQLTLSLDPETIIQKNPDVILVTRQGDLGNSWLSRWKQWTFLNAVKNNQLYTVNPDFVVRHTPRILDGIEQVCTSLHPQ